MTGNHSQMAAERWLTETGVEARIDSRREQLSIWPMNARSQVYQVMIGLSDAQHEFDPVFRVELTVLEWLQETRERDALFMASTMEPHHEGLMMRVFDHLQSLTIPAGSVLALGRPELLTSRLDQEAFQALMRRAFPQLAMSKTETLRRHMKQAVVFMAASCNCDERQMSQVLSELAQHSRNYPKVVAA